MFSSYDLTELKGNSCLRCALIRRLCATFPRPGEGFTSAALAAYMVYGKGKTLEAYLDEDIFTDMPSVTMEPDPADVAGYEQFMTRYTAGLDIERKAVETMKE